MRARVLFVGLVAISVIAIAGSASAKASIAAADVSGPGLDGGMRIEGPDTEGLYDSGIDVVGGTDDTRADSVEELGLTPADLGPRYLVTYRFDHGPAGLIRQDVYPYAYGGPVTYTPPDQELTVGIEMQITAGWYRSSRDFFRYLVDHGLPETNPAAAVAPGQPPSDPAPASRTAPWEGIVVVLMGLAALSLAVLTVRRRTLAGAR